MDLTRPVGPYRGFALNDAVQQDGRLVGCQLSEAQWLGVQGVGYTEKKAQGDGNDSADLFLGPRRLQLIGTLYGDSRADLFDREEALLAAFTPTLAYADAPDDRGYQPLPFEVPTLDVANFPSGYRAMFVNVRPLTQPNEVINRDRIGGIAALGASLPWALQVEAEDPIKYLAAERELAVSFNITGADVTGTLVLVNHGNYPAPIRLRLDVTASAGLTIFRWTLGGADLTFTCPASAVNYAVEYDSRTALTYIVDLAGAKTLALDIPTVNTEVLRPMVPPGGGNLGYDASLGHATATFDWFESWA